MFEYIKKATKFSKDDQEYLARRRTFAKEIGRPDLWSSIDQFGLYVGIQTLARELAIYEIMKKCLTVPGHVVEFGCWHGANLMFMAKILHLLQPNGTKKVIGFDSFEGLRTFSAKDGNENLNLEGGYKGEEEILRKTIELFGFEEWVHLVKGNALETIPRFAEEFPYTLISMAYIDFDLYSPCKAALDFLDTRLATGGVIMFDEALLDSWPGEGEALTEFLKGRQGSYKMFSTEFARQPTVYLVKQG